MLSHGDVHRTCTTDKAGALGSWQWQPRLSTMSFLGEHLDSGHSTQFGLEIPFALRKNLADGELLLKEILLKYFNEF